MSVQQGSAGLVVSETSSGGDITIGKVRQSILVFALGDLQAIGHVSTVTFAFPDFVAGISGARFVSAEFQNAAFAGPGLTVAAGFILDTSAVVITGQADLLGTNGVAQAPFVRTDFNGVSHIPQLEIDLTGGFFDQLTSGSIVVTLLFVVPS